MRSEKAKAILRILIDEGGLHGLEIVRRSKGDICRGTVYSTLQRMEEKGLVSSRRENKPPSVPGIQLRLYRVTREGRRSV